MAFYLGIDGGGSKTTCAVGDESSVLATVTAGPSNITRVGEVRVREALHHAIREACTAAKIEPRQVHRACIGIAGAGRKEVAGTIYRIAVETLSGEISVVGDMEIAMAAAFGAGPGVIVIAGTGSIAYGRNAQGRTARAGGWGFAISDEGSAHWTGRRAVTTLLRAIDQESGRESFDPEKNDHPLWGKLKAAWNLHTLDEFARTANSNPNFADLFPAIVAAADGGDTIAQGVLKQAGREVAQLAGIVTRRLFAEDSASPPDIPLAMAGGVFRYSPLVCQVIRDELRQLDLRLQVNPQIIEPVNGALQMARQGQATIRQ
ncbi:MAG TPA: BadF/BadG/BcrA/BcrD ATPase family protein [Candidatus Acidoferrum sp.]|nr:BadF/BadG/BcrA/BcrD ATPase family protein [Candidatus Acidoferrum sp.]